MKEKIIRVLKIEPQKPPVEAELKNELSSLQESVGGLIEFLPLDSSKGIELMCNEEGKLLGLDGNRRQGVNVKVAQARWGQKDITTAMNIYSHVLPSSAREALDKIG